MLYIFIILLVLSSIKEREVLLKEKKNIGFFLVLSIIGIALGIVHMVNPYLPSLAMVIEKYLK